MSMKLGRIPTPAHRLSAVPRLADFLDLAVALPLIADSVDYGKRMTKPWGMLGNDRYGDCVFASLAHFKQCASVNVTGTPRTFTEAEVLRWYAEQTGFKPSDPSTDNGAIPLDALKYFVSIGEVVAFGKVDPDNDAHVASTIELYGGLWSGWDLPTAWENADEWTAGPTQTGIWTPGSWGGHMTSQTGYDAQCNTPTVTWGGVTPTTNGARHVYCSEAYAIITKEWLDSRGGTIQGLDLDGLKAAIAALQ